MSTAKKRPLQKFKIIRPMLSRARRFVLAGPIRPAIVSYYRTSSKAKPIETKIFEDLHPFSIEEIVETMKKDGVATGLSVSEQFVEQLLECYASNPKPMYNNPHLDHEIIREIAADERLIEVSRAYLGSEPILLSSMMHTYEPGRSSDADYFHYDVGDALTITLFIYLTDVDEERGVTHVVIPGTHKSKRLSELWDSTLSDEKAAKRYPGQLQTVLGKRGTTWFEDVQMWHKHGHVGQLRKMLSLTYSLHRQP